MKYALGISLVVGSALLGAAVDHALSQAAKPAYVVVTQNTVDEARFAPFVQRFATEVAKAGGKFLARAKPTETIEGQPVSRVTVIEFKSVNDARKYYASPEMKKILEERKSLVKDSNIFIVEGL